MRGRCIWLLLVAFLGFVGCGGDARPKAVRTESLPGSVVEADGHKVYFECEGKGSPTVVFVSGLGADSSSWVPVFDQTSRLTRSCAYDRYGTGQTTYYGGALSQTPRDADDQVRELEQLLENAEIAKPYVRSATPGAASCAAIRGYARRRESGRLRRLFFARRGRRAAAALRRESRTSW